MNFSLNCSERHSHRGVIGVESAIVMIAFVIVAAALAFVVLNMGNNAYDKQEESEIQEPKNIEDCTGLEVHTSQPCYALVLEKKIEQLTALLENQKSLESDQN